MKRLLRIILLSVLAGISLVDAAVPAYAGTNGQQIKLYEASNIGSVCIYGYNQNASWIQYCPTAPAAIFHTNNYSGYWWKTYNGVPVSLYYYGAADWTNYLGSNTCSVPEYQPGSDWWQCNSV